MKEIIAIIRPQKWAATKAKLEEIGVMAFTEHRVFGRGRQNGLRYLKPGSIELSGITYIPKRMVHIVTTDENVEKIVSVISEVNRTPAMGDGKIFVCPMDEAIRIRTQEIGAAALA